jgi:CubicO group peptidase (beta-lactamase class C family)
MSKTFAIFCCLFISSHSFSQQTYQPPRFKDSASRVEKIKATQAVVDKMFKEHAERNHFPGFVWGVVVDGKLLYSGSTGFTNVAKKIPANSNSDFRIASMTKSFTTLAIVKLRDEGKINLDDPASKYIPEMKKIKYLTSDAGAITVRQLMNHTAGFPEDNPWGDRQLADSDKELLDLVSNDVSFSNVPGLTYEYSNLGFALLGRIVTNVSGKPYQQYIHETIFKPLGMNNTYWEYKKVPAEKLAHGYRWQNNSWLEENLLSDGSYGAMGGLITTIEDFAKYMALHMNAWPPRSEKENPILKRSSLREMQTSGVFSGLNTRFRYPNGRICAVTSSYAYGLGLTRDCGGKIWIGHSGGLPGFGSNWRFYPDYGIGVVCFANLTYAPTGSINLAVIDTIMKLADLKPRTLPVSQVLQQRKEQLLKLLPEWNNATSSGIFAENFFPDTPLDSLKKLSASLFKNAGNITKVTELLPENQLRGSFVMEGEKSDIVIFFTLTPEKVPLIQQLDMFERKKPSP